MPRAPVETPVGTPVEDVTVDAFTIPTDGPDGREQDGTLTWSSTTIVTVRARTAGRVGIGYTYADASAAELVAGTLAPVVVGADAFAPPAACRAMLAAIRNNGQSGLGAMAVSAVDIALWDLKARLLDLPLVRVLPAVHDRVPVYGSGGFTNYPIDRLVDQLGGWVAQGIPRVKLKTSRDPDDDPRRLSAVRAAIGDAPELFVDANGALSGKRALEWAWRFRERWAVSWFEEPVSSLDLTGLRRVRHGGPPGLDIAAGEYGFGLTDFTDLLAAEAVDCLQADVTRCAGITGLLQVAGLAAAHQIDLSAHCAPAVSAHAFCAVPTLRHLEYFHDHARIENMLFDGAQPPRGGALCPDPTRPGLGLEIRWSDAERYRAPG